MRKIRAFDLKIHLCYVWRYTQLTCDVPCRRRNFNGQKQRKISLIETGPRRLATPLADLLEERNWTQAQLADRLGVSRKARE